MKERSRTPAPVLMGLVVVSAVAVWAGLTGVGIAAVDSTEVESIIAMEGTDLSQPSIDADSGRAGIAFMAGWGADSDIYYSGETVQGWSTPVRISPSDTGDNSPDLALSPEGYIGVAYWGVDDPFGMRRRGICFAEDRGDGWTYELALACEPESIQVVYRSGQPHIIFTQSAEVTDTPVGEVHHLYRDGAGEWQVEELEGPLSSGEYSLLGSATLDSNGGNLAWAWTQVDLADGVVDRSTRRVVGGFMGAASPGVLLPNPNDTADHTAYLRLDEQGAMRVLYARGNVAGAADSYYIRQQGSVWDEALIAAEHVPFALAYDQRISL